MGLHKDATSRERSQNPVRKMPLYPTKTVSSHLNSLIPTLQLPRVQDLQPSGDPEHHGPLHELRHDGEAKQRLTVEALGEAGRRLINSARRLIFMDLNIISFYAHVQEVARVAVDLLEHRDHHFGQLVHFDVPVRQQLDAPLRFHAAHVDEQAFVLKRFVD
jgi:hypothetical protein